MTTTAAAAIPAISRGGGREDRDPASAVRSGRGALTVPIAGGIVCSYAVSPRPACPDGMGPDAMVPDAMVPDGLGGSTNTGLGAGEEAPSAGARKGRRGGLGIDGTRGLSWPRPT
jgi:hypothetical protein